MTKKILFVFVLLFFNISLPLLAQEKDSINSILLNEVKITDFLAKDTISKQSSSSLDKSTIEKITSSSVGELAKYIAGLTVRDYGGLGGLKTISVRGLGSNHSAIVYDGISVTDFQTGQVDLSKFSSNNIKEINLFNGQSYSLLQTARALSSSNVFIIETLNPQFDSLQKMKAELKTSYGSFNYANLGLNVAYRINKIWTTWLDFDVQNSAGNYPYLLRYGYNETDSTSKEIRKNSDYFGVRGEWNGFASFNSKTDLKLKAYYFYSERGLPMSTTLYYLNSSQRLWDENFFLQASFTHKINNRLTYRTNAKTLYSYSHFLDPKTLNVLGYQSDKYYQREYYLNNIFSLRITDKLSSSFTNDFIYNNLNTSSSFYSKADRTSSISALSLLYDNSKLIINTNVLHYVVSDYSNRDIKRKIQNYFSPYFSVGYTWNNIFSLSAFFKDSFRMPSFNDLYFNRVSPSILKPEQTQQWNIHSAFTLNFGSYKTSLLTISLDCYYNNVRNKIVAVPQRNLFVWSIINFGEVNIKGLDMQTSFRFYLPLSIDLNIRTTYSFQRAIDVSNPISNSYKQQIPYTPLHSGTLFLNITHPFMDFSYTINFVGKRYALAENIDRNMLKAYMDHSITFSKDFNFNKTKINIGLSCLNLLAEQYEVVRNYPMPQRQFRINLKMYLK
ncbi:MAG: TonB-dependent receptor [Bacteroidales bacterium]|nr:TonB-dependent receptor [Bacteroidales bacterium]